MEIAVRNAQLLPRRDVNMWALAIEVTHNDGHTENLIHVFPEDAIEWRVAEYGLDPETALTMILAEPYFNTTDEDQAALDTAPTRTASRAMRLERLAAVLPGGVISMPGGPKPMADSEPQILESGTEDPVEVILRESPVSDEHIAVKREVAREIRAERIRRRADRTQQPVRRPRESAAELRARLIPDNPDNNSTEEVRVGNAPGPARLRPADPPVR